MKRRMKIKALLSLASVATLAMGVGLALSNLVPLEIANAETTYTEEVFMVNGASIRYSEPAGIRFTGYVKDDGDLSDNVVGFKITVGGVEKDFSTATLEGATWQWAASDVEGYQKFQVAITGIPEAQYATEMTAQAYVDNYKSAEIVTRSVARVANAALTANTLEQTLDTDKVNALEKYVNKSAVNLPFDTTDVTISNGSLTWHAVDNAKGYLVQFGDEVRNFPTTGAGLYSVSLNEFAGEVVSITMLPYGDGTAYTYAETPYTTVYDSNKLMVTFDTDGGSQIGAVQVERGTTMAEFYKQKYIPADSGFIFDYWLCDGERVDEMDIVTEDMTLVARYKRVDGYAVEESPVNGDFYQAFLAIPTDMEEGESVLVTMDIFLTGKIVSKNVDTTDEYYNQWATSSIRWVDSVWTTDGGEVKNSAEAVSFNTLRANEGNWVTVSFVATVRNFPVLKTGTGWADVEMGNGNAVYLYAANFKSAASFNYKNVQVSATTSMPAGTQKTTPDQYYQSAIGLPTELAAGTFAKVEMDVMVTGTVDDYSYIRWVDTVYSAGGEVNNAPAIADYATMSAHAGEWIHVEFYATVRDFDVLRLNSAYPTMDVSETGTGVFLVAESFLSSNTFVYKDVTISADEADVGVAMPAGTQKTSNANGYYQSVVGLPTDFAAGTPVWVEMDVYITGAYDQYTTGIQWVDTVYGNGSANTVTTVLNYATISANVGEWIHVSFPATVRDFDTLRMNDAYGTVDVSSYGNAVFLLGANFKSAASFNYKNVSIVGRAVDGGGKVSGNAIQYRQAVAGLPTNLPVGTSVTVDMDIYITGTYDQYVSGIHWVDTVWTTEGGELQSNPKIVDYATISANVGKWIHVTFDATVRNFSVLRIGTEYNTMDTSAYGNAVYLVANSFTSAESFIYKNVTMKATLSVPDGVKKSNGYYQAFVGLSTDYEVGTTVAVGMDIYVTGTVDSATEIRWVDSVWTTSGGEVNANPVILSNAQLIAGAGQWIHVEFEATVRNFSVLRMDTSFTTMDVSAYGNAVYIMSKNFKSAASFNYKNVTIKLPGEDEPEEPEVPVIEGVAMPAGTQKTTPDKYYQSAVGISTDLPAGTFVKVDMDVYVTGTIDEYSYISWISSVWGDNAVEKETKIATYAEMSANAGEWMHLEFYAYVRDFDLLRREATYPTIDVSATGTGVFIFAANFTSVATFHYDNVVISADEADVGVAMPDGTKKTSNADAYYQAFVGLPVSVPAGTEVNVSMEVYVTGTYDSYTSVNWVDTVYSTSGGEAYNIPTIVDYATMSANVGKWIHVEFEATVRDFAVLRLNSAYATVDVSETGNGVFLLACQFKSAASFYYRNVVITADGVDVAVKDDYTPEVYTSNGKNITDYSIVVSDTASKSTQYAATILQARLRDALGVDLAVITDATEKQPYEIILGKTNRDECSVIDFSLLDSESFRVQNVGYDLVIAGNERGALYGVYAYLEALGYRFYTVDVERIPAAEDVFVPSSIELTWTPAFEYRETMYEMTWDEEWAVSQRVNSDFLRGDLKADSQYGGFVGYVGGNSWTVHTLWRLLPEMEFSANPTYFAELNGERNAKNSDGHYNQPCLSSEGAYQLILKNALAMIASDRKANIISISENDGGDYCTCSACQASYAQYGVSGTFFRFINRIAGDIAKVYPDVYVDTLSYAMSKEVPTGITLAENVIVRVCPRMCNFCTDPSTCENLAADQQRIKDFVAICDNVYVWCYPINWGNLFASLPNYEEMRNNIRFFAMEGVKGIYAEGYSKENPEFGELKAYLMAKLLQNPMMSKAEYEYHLNDFLQGYYGEAAEYIAKYISLTEEMIDKRMESGHLDKYYTVEENFVFTWNSSTKTYDMTYINQINALWDAALASVENGSTQWHNVKKSMTHWTYIELCNTMDKRYQNGTAEEKAALVARNEALYNDLVYYGITRIFDNSHDLIEVTDFTKSPHKDKGDWFNQKWTIGDLI